MRESTNRPTLSVNVRSVPTLTGEPVAAAGAAEEDRQLVADEFAAAAGEDRWAVGEARPLLLAAASGKPSDAGAVCEYGAADCGVAGTSGIELGGWQMKKLDNKGVGDGKVSQKSVNLRLGFASQGRTTIWPSTTTTICCDGPRENRPNRKAQVYNRYVSEAKMEILGKI